MYPIHYYTMNWALIAIVSLSVLLLILAIILGVISTSSSNGGDTAAMSGLGDTGKLPTDGSGLLVGVGDIIGGVPPYVPSIPPTTTPIPEPPTPAPDVGPCMVHGTDVCAGTWAIRVPAADSGGHDNDGYVTMEYADNNNQINHPLSVITVANTGLRNPVPFRFTRD